MSARFGALAAQGGPPRRRGRGRLFQTVCSKQRSVALSRQTHRAQAELWAAVVDLREELGVAYRSIDLWRDRANEGWLSKFLGNMCTANRPEASVAQAGWSWFRPDAPDAQGAAWEPGADDGAAQRAAQGPAQRGG